MNEGILVRLKLALSVCYHWVGGDVISTYWGEAAWTSGYRPRPAILPAVVASRFVSTTCFCFILGRSESRNKVVCKWPTGKLRLVSRGFFCLVIFCVCSCFFLRVDY